MVTLERPWTAVEEVALGQLLEHLGLPNTALEDALAFEETATLPTVKARKWTRAQREAQSRKMKAYWRGRRRGK